MTRILGIDTSNYTTSCALWQDGVILDGVAYDRTGAVIGDGSGKEVQGIGFGGLLIFHDDAGYGVLYPDGTEAVPASLSNISFIRGSRPQAFSIAAGRRKPA